MIEIVELHENYTREYEQPVYRHIIIILINKELTN